MTLYGVDVSAYQKDVDWTKVRGTGRSFRFIKATQGTQYVNAYLQRDRSAPGFILTGLYHFASAKGDPIAEADHFLATVLPLKPGEVVVLDSEGPAVSQAWATTWAARVTQAGINVIGIYCNTSDFKDIYRGSVPPGYNWWWAAQYSPIPPTNDKWTFWQYSSNATVDGVPGPCDDSQFRGTEADLSALVAGTGPSPAPTPTPKLQGDEMSQVFVEPGKTKVMQFDARPGRVFVGTDEVGDWDPTLNAGKGGWSSAKTATIRLAIGSVGTFKVTDRYAVGPKLQDQSWELPGNARGYVVLSVYPGTLGANAEVVYS